MLTDTVCKNSHRSEKAKLGKAFKISGGQGLYLLLKPGAYGQWNKYFRFNFTLEGKEKTLALGTYPETSLVQAREKMADAKKLIAQGIDPAVNRKAIKTAKAEAATNSFEVIAKEWLLKKCQDNSDRPLRLLNTLIPYIGLKPITDILPKDILACVRRLEESGKVESAHRALRTASQVFRYAVATGRAERDVTQDLRGALTAIKGGHFAAVTDPKEVGGLLRAIDGYQGSFPVRCALKLAPLVFVRPGELRAARWEDIDLEAKEWRYFVTKTQVQHVVPLSRQAVQILMELEPITGHLPYLFPSERTPNGDRCMSENTLTGALKRLGYGQDMMTAHGFRAMARTILDEVLGFRPDYIEHQLAHNVKDPLGRAYNRTSHLKERRAMMQTWADYLDKLKSETTNVVAIRKQA